MFLCDTCLNKKYSNQPSIGRSYGLCEVCGKRKECSDISSSRLNLLCDSESDEDYSNRICLAMPEGHVHTAEELGISSGKQLDAIGARYNCPRKKAK